MQGRELSESLELLSWCRRWMAPLGIWPKDNNNLRFALSFIYILIFQATEFFDLIYNAKTGEEILMIDMMKEDCADEFRTFEEHEKSAVYYSVAKTFNKIARLLYLLTGILCCLTPLPEYLFTTAQNGTRPFVLPFRAYIFYEMTDIYTFAVAYTYQVGAVFIINLGAVPMDGLLIALTVHVSKQLSDLAESITDITKDKKDFHCNKVRVMVKQHLRLIWMAKQINKEFSSSFLCQVLCAGLLICLSGYQVVTNFDVTQTTTLLTFLGDVITMLTILYGYCFIGEILIEESQRVCNAFYQCEWYEIPPSQSKDFIICMAGSKKPLQLSAGPFCNFSFALFSQVVQTAVGYVSVLCTLM